MSPKYTPLNLSFLSNQYSPQRDSIANTAAMIMANAGWSKPTQASLRDIATAKAKAKKEFNSSHKQSFLSSVFDLLQTPLYGVANALDESLAGHQSDSNDSVLADIGKTVGGVFTGAGRGVGAGLRGASGILDVLPGVDINDEWQSNPEDKTHFSDVAIRQMTGMSTADAMKPENWAKVKDILNKVNQKPWYDKTLFEAAAPNDLEGASAREKFFRNEALAGIPVDIAGDPLNFMLPGIGAARGGVKATEGLTEGLSAARGTKDTNNAILAGLKAKNGSVFSPKADLNAASPIQTFGTPAKAASAAKLPPTPLPKIDPDIASQIDSGIKIGGQSKNDILRDIDEGLLDPWSTMTQGEKVKAKAYVEAKFSGTPSGTQVTTVSPEAPKYFKTLANLGRRESSAEPGILMTPRDQQRVASEIAKMAALGQPSWRSRAAQYLNMVGDGRVEWNHTASFLQKADNAVKSKGLKHDPARMTPVLMEHMRRDMQAAQPASKEVARRVTNTANTGDIVVRPNAPRLKVPEARLANQVVRRFEGQILGKKAAPGTGEGLARAIASGNNVRYSGPQQARMWNQITSNLKGKFGGDVKKYSKAVRILRAVEDYFISKGIIPHSAAKTSESVPLRLSQVAEAIGPQVLGQSHAFITGILRGDPKALAHLSPDQLEAIRGLRASEATATAPAVQKGLLEAKSAADQIAKLPMSVGRKTGVINSEAKRISQFVAEQGGGDVGAHVAKQYFGNLTGADDPINAVLNTNKLKTEEWLSKTGKSASGAVNDADFVRSVNNAIVRAANLPSPAVLGKVAGAAAKVSDWLGARFNAAYGIQDMRPIFLRDQSSAMSTTARRARLLNDLGREFDPNDADLWHEAFRTAQQNGIADGRVAALQSEIAKVMENLFGGTGLRNGAISSSTIVGRNRILLDELNKNLKRFGLGKYKFESGKKVATFDGGTRDLSQGVDWLKSWETWDVAKPYEFLHKVQNSIEFTVREKNMFDEIVSRFGSSSKSGAVKYGVNHPRLHGYYFTKEAAQQAQTFVHMLEEVSTPNSKAFQYFDHVLSKLKASLTIYIPGHHMTNLIGSVYFDWIAGVNKPIRYEQAMKTMLAQKGRYGDFANFEKLAGPKALEQAIARSVLKPGHGLNVPAAGNKVVITMQNGTKLTADMIYMAAFREGVLPSAKVLEDVESGATSIIDKFKPLGGRGQRTVHEISEVREHIPRLALFIDRLAKSKGTFPTAVNDAARAVRKWHPDGIDFTNFERKVMKRVFPFYSWTRKAIPLAIESTLFNGNKVMAYPRLMEAIGLINGVEPTQSVTDPFPSDQMFPDWLRTRGIGPIAGSAGNYLDVNPSTPVLDVLSQVGSPGDTAIQMMNPMGKVPIEVAQGETLGQKVPIQGDQQWLDYFTKQIPVASQLGRASGVAGVSDSTKAEGFPNWNNILNLLTGAKAVNTGKYQRSAQFDLRDYFRQKASQQGR
jgi:hypothetical protein